MSQQGRQQVAAIFEQWLADRYPGTCWVASVERPERDGSTPRSGQVDGEVLRRDDNDPTGERLAV